jgi:glutathione S-transferase
MHAWWDMPEPVLYGADYSVYTRIARLALAEKGVGYRFEPVDIFAPGGPPAAYRARHPFARIPAFAHGEVALYEAAAITRYVDEAFAGPPLQPADAAARARMTQIISVLNSYVFRPLVLDLYVQRVSVPRRGGTPDEARIAASLPECERCLAALAALQGDSDFLVGEALTLADLHAAPMFAYARLAPEGAAMLTRHANLAAWWQRMEVRTSLSATRFPAELQ